MLQPDLRARYVVRCLALIAAALSLAACGGGGGGPSSAANTAATTASASPAASAVTPASSASTASTAATDAAASATTGASATSAVAASSTAVPGQSTINFTAAPAISTARVLPASPVWAVYYSAGSAIDIAQASTTFNLIIIDADPANGSPSFTPAQITALKAHGAKVLSYLNFGACEKTRTYWSTVPTGFVSCGANTAAQIAQYTGYPEYWMNPANADYQNLIVNFVAPRLAATGVDGFMLDNFEIVGHGASASIAPCNASCAQGGLDLVAKLRARFPDLALVPNAAPVSVIGGTTGGTSFPWLIDGTLTEQVFLPSKNTSAVQGLQTWQSTEQNLGRSNFFAGSLDYVSACTATASAQSAWTAARQLNLSPSIATSALDRICWWSFLTAGN